MKTAVLGLGEEIKGDDGIGKYVIDRLRKKKISYLLVYSSVPENAFVKLRGKQIDKLIIVDAADFSGRPGEFRIIKNFSEQKRLSTHSTSISNIMKYIKKSIGIADIELIAIQVKSIGFGSRMSKEVRKAGDTIVGLLS
jgi:hydrogenase 3 maturation protease